MRWGRWGESCITMGSCWGYNGVVPTFNLRLPDDLYDEIQIAAADDGRSMNSYIVRVLQGRVPLSPKDEEAITKLLARPAKKASKRVAKRPPSRTEHETAQDIVDSILAPRKRQSPDSM